MSHYVIRIFDWWRWNLYGWLSILLLCSKIKNLWKTRTYNATTDVVLVDISKINQKNSKNKHYIRESIPNMNRTGSVIWTQGASLRLSKVTSVKSEWNLGVFLRGKCIIGCWFFFSSIGTKSCRLKFYLLSHFFFWKIPMPLDEKSCNHSHVKQSCQISESVLRNCP